MAKRKKTSTFEDLLLVLMQLVALVIRLVIKLVLVGVDYVSYKKTLYKDKSGVGFFKMYSNKGYYGEFTLYQKMCKLLGEERVLTNIYLDGHTTKTTEIDVISVTNKGIYVFEMKNYGGYIYGSENDQKWTQVMNRYTKHPFYNPLRQNYAHTKAVEKYLDIDSNVIYPMVVFSNRSKLSKINVSNTIFVGQMKSAMNVVKKNELLSSNRYTDDEVIEMIAKLRSKSLQNTAFKEAHIESIEAYLNE